MFPDYDPAQVQFEIEQEFFAKLRNEVSPKGAYLVREFISTASGGFLDIKNFQVLPNKAKGIHGFIDELIDTAEDGGLDDQDFVFIEGEHGYIAVLKVIPDSGIDGEKNPSAIARSADEMARINRFRKFVNTERYLENWEHGELFAEHFEKFAKSLDCAEYIWAYVGGTGEDPGQFTNPQGTARQMRGLILHDEFIIAVGVERK